MTDINLTPTAFPVAFQWSLADYISENLIVDDSGCKCQEVMRRPLRFTDPDYSVGVVNGTWDPQVHEIGQNAATTAKYSLEVWASVKGLNEEEASQRHAVLARNVRRLMAEDTALRTLWASHTDTHGTHTERYLMHHLRGQEFHANNVKAQFMFLSVATVEITTENIHV